MKNTGLRIRNIILIPMLIVALGLCVTPKNAQAEVKELIIGIGIDADTLLPYDQTTTLMQNMADLIYDSFLYQDPEGKLHPRLATSYEVSPDGLTYTIHLRKGVKFSDGSDFNADAAKAGWDNVLNPETRVPLRFAVGMVKECVKIDDYTIQLKLKFAFAPLAPTIAMSLISPISPAALKKYGEDIRQHPTGAGPYILDKWVKGDRIENYWGPKPTVAKIIWKIVPEAATREAMLRAGQIHICYKPLPSNVAALKADPNVTVEMPLDTRTIFMGLNYQKGVTTNKKVRQAFNYAVDKKAIVKKILFGTAEPMDGPVSPKVFGYHKMAHQYDYDPEKAKQLLKEANFDFSKTVSMRTPQGRYLFDRQVSEAIQAYLQAIGVKAESFCWDGARSFWMRIWAFMVSLPARSTPPKDSVPPFTATRNMTRS